MMHGEPCLCECHGGVPVDVATKRACVACRDDHDAARQDKRRELNFSRPARRIPAFAFRAGK